MHRQRIRSLMSVDDLVDGLLQRLSNEGLLVSSGKLVQCIVNYDFLLGDRKTPTYFLHLIMGTKLASLPTMARHDHMTQIFM